jgi:hypothetical protein
VEEAPRLVYNPEDGSVMLQTSGPAVTVDGIIGEVTFERLTEDGSALALWLEAKEADVLVKMIGYILEKVRIQPESKELLGEVLPRVQTLLERHTNG